MGVITINARQGRTEIAETDVSRLAAEAEAVVRNGFCAIWDARLRLDLADSLRDTLKSGMIGLEFTSLTTTIGYEGAKELSTRPGWAAWLVRQLIEKHVRPGDKVAISMTGSFPALNLAALAALQVIGAEVRGVSSIGSSSFGANELGFSWPEMERMLKEAGILKVGSSAVTLGGTGDRGVEWDPETRNLALDAVRRCALPLIHPVRLSDAVKKRLQFYGEPKQYAVFINIGGGSATLGGGAKMRFTRGGWFTEPMGTRGEPDGVMDAFLEAGVPCLNLLYLDDLNRRESILSQ